MGSLNRIKDQTTLLHAMVEVVKVEPTIHLDIIGEDTLHGQIQGLSRSLGLESYVTFRGFLPNDDARGFYRQADLFLLTSRHESGPIAVLEAAAVGVPTVGTRVGHIADWAGTEAVAVPVSDATALAHETLTLLQDEERRHRLGRAAQVWTRHYSADWTAAQFTEIYGKLLHR